MRLGAGRRVTARGMRACRTAGTCLWLALLPLVAAACTGGQTTATTTITALQLPLLRLPSQLAGYHIFVADLATGDVAELGIQTQHVARSVHGLGLSADGRTLYVSAVSDGRLDAFALADGRLAGEHSAPVGDQPVHMVNTLDGRTIFVTNFESGTVSVVDSATWRHVKDLTVPARPHGIVLSPDGRWAYVACYGAASIAVIDTESATLAATIAMPEPSQPYGIAISPDGRYLYASDNLLGRLLVVDAAARKYVRSVQIGVRPALIARSPDGRTLYVTNGVSHSVSVLDIGTDPAKPAVRATVVVDGYPHGLAVTPDGRYVVVANTLGGDLSAIDTRTVTVVATVKGEQDPNDVIIPA
jgi:YVTN family beta-propeller protein